MEIRQISWSDQAAFEKFQALLLVEKAAGNSFHLDWSTSTNYYYFLDNELVARIGCRWQLEKGDLERFGGHIGYVTRPDYRRQGIMTELLLFALECYRKRGILRVLITANRYNIASRRTIEKVGGILEDIVQVPMDYNVSSMAGQELARYWINLGEK